MTTPRAACARQFNTPPQRHCRGRDGLSPPLPEGFRRNRYAIPRYPCGWPYRRSIRSGNCRRLTRYPTGRRISLRLPAPSASIWNRDRGATDPPQDGLHGSEVCRQRPLSENSSRRSPPSRCSRLRLGRETPPPTSLAEQPTNRKYRHWSLCRPARAVLVQRSPPGSGFAVCRHAVWRFRHLNSPSRCIGG